MDTTSHTKITGMSPLLIVSDIDHSIGFYTGNLNFVTDFRYEDFYAGIVKDGYSIHLKMGKPTVEERKTKRNNEDVDIIFSVDDIENLYEAISGKPVEIIQPLRNMPYGREFYITNPNGYIIAFVE